MKRKPQKGKPAIELIEEASQLLRRAPVAVHVLYYTGSIPFVLALLHFWSDMSRGAFAYDRIGGSSLRVALLFVWMKCWQSASSEKLIAFLSGSPETPWTLARIVRLAVSQAALQPTALFVRPLALLMVLPYGMVRAFYENAVIFGEDETDGLRGLCGRAKRQAVQWPGQNYLVLGFLMFFGMMVWMNFAILLLAAPHLLKMLTGMETAFTRSPIAMLNTTFLATSMAGAYLCVNPFTKAVYVLRCFYGESVISGADLRLALRRAALPLLLAMLAIAPFTTKAANTPAGGAGAQIDPQTLGSSIERVLKRDEFAWRLPRQKPPEANEGIISRFLDDAGRVSWGWVKQVGKWTEKLMEKIRDWMPKYHPSEESSGPSLSDLSEALKAVLWVLCAIIVCILVWFFWKNRSALRRRTPVRAVTTAILPDLSSEDLLASQLPEDEWLKLARSMIEKGDFRLAVRALYLAALAHLGGRELISIARHKSNRDYQRELIRRARTQENLLVAFGESVSIFEGAWYGMHETSQATTDQFTNYLERIRTA